jgi:hypothetical protein
MLECLNVGVFPHMPTFQHPNAESLQHSNIPT